jgi:glycosyltransferase involved in cell wall biosynthesis
MSCGCPVITTSSSSTPEVAGEAALYANTPEALANALIEVQKPAAREALIHSGYERATQFSWATTALQIRQLCQAVLATSTQRLSAACASDSSKISH